MFALGAFGQSAQLAYFFSDDVLEGVFDTSVTPYADELLNPVDSFLGLRALPLTVFEGDPMLVSAVENVPADIEPNLLNAELNADFLNSVSLKGDAFEMGSVFPTVDLLDENTEFSLNTDLFTPIIETFSADEIRSVATEVSVTLFDDDFAVSDEFTLPQAAFSVEESSDGFLVLIVNEDFLF